MEKVIKFLEKHPGIARILDPYLRKLPAVQKKIEKEYDELLADMEHSLKPYSSSFEKHFSLPKKGREKKAVLKDIRSMFETEKNRWEKGYVSGGIYHGDSQHIDFLNQVYNLHSQANPLHSDIFPSSAKFEAEIISMTANMLSKNQAQEMDICGSVTSGGTESILLAMKTYRDRARNEKGIRKGEIIAPVTAHTAFDKAAGYFGIKLIRTPIGKDFRADIPSIKNAITGNTIAIIGSAPNFPHGIIDPIKEMSELAMERKIGFHTDCCLGGFVLPFAEALGEKVPEFDFRLPGVTSMSADTHKFGYAAKGTSVVLYRGNALRQYQYFTVTDWPGGLYFSPTMAGSRPGGLSAACWAAMVSIGEKGYLESVRKIIKAASEIKKGIREIPELKILGEPLWIIAFASDELDIYRVLDQMNKKGWSLNGLHRPACVHICTTLRHAQPGVTKRFLTDLKDSVRYVKANPSEKGGMAPVYGMAGTLPIRSAIGDLLKKYMDVIYKV
ncbi:MAG: aminotransferase class V-fold PLP-dependent enzyme [Leptospiraceae bacterium]|nr:aminotransferase class V-fold PLP-dependent enzyme [Leptospiraceae bacterium]